MGTNKVQSLITAYGDPLSVIVWSGHIQKTLSLFFVRVILNINTEVKSECIPACYQVFTYLTLTPGRVSRSLFAPKYNLEKKVYGSLPTKKKMERIFSCRKNGNDISYT